MEASRDSAKLLDQLQIIERHRADPSAATAAAASGWHREMARPLPRSTKQANLVSYRNAEVKRILTFLRSKWYPSQYTRSAAQRRTDGLGSPFTGFIPGDKSASNITVDHCVPKSWMEATCFVGSWSNVAEDMFQTIPVPKTENSAKGNRPTRFISTNRDDPRRTFKGLYDPRHFWTKVDRASTRRAPEFAACRCAVLF